MIYFDNAATTYPKPKAVYDGITYAMQNYAFNAGRGSYKVAKETYAMIQNTREKLGSVIGVRGEKVIFTGSATESLNNIIYGLNLSKDDIVFVSPFEHNAVVRTLYNVGVKIEIIPFDKKTWKLKEKEFKDFILLKKPKAVIISHISNVTGYELPYKEIFEISKLVKAVTVLDCAQSYAIYPIEKINIDFVVFAGHKSLYAMFGIAGYINISNINLKKYKVGGTGSDSLNLNMPEELPFSSEAGSLNSIGIYSINCALDFLKKQNFALVKMNLVTYFLQEIRKIDGITIYLPENYISRGIVSFNINGYSSDEVAMIFAEDYNICVRAGYHCSPYIHDFIEAKKFNGTVRISFSGYNSTEEIEELLHAIKDIIRE